MQVAELMVSGGYTTELLSRAVGPTGTVYGENPKVVLERFAQKPWTERLARLPNATRLDRELDDPATGARHRPPQARSAARATGSVSGSCGRLSFSESHDSPATCLDPTDSVPS